MADLKALAKERAKLLAKLNTAEQMVSALKRAIAEAETQIAAELTTQTGQRGDP